MINTVNESLLSPFACAFSIASIAPCTSFSLYGSRALVASSNIRIFGFFSNALAIASLYFCPPDKFTTELVPINVSSPLSKSNTNSALAFSNARFICSSEASLLPKRRFSLMVPMIKVGS